MVCRDAAEIEVSGTEGESGKRMTGDTPGNTAEGKDTQVINAAQYKM